MKIHTSEYYIFCFENLRLRIQNNGNRQAKCYKEANSHTSELTLVVENIVIYHCDRILLQSQRTLCQILNRGNMLFA